jgi:hypothetical protein
VANASGAALLISTRWMVRSPFRSDGNLLPARSANPAALTFHVSQTNRASRPVFLQWMDSSNVLKQGDWHRPMRQICEESQRAPEPVPVFQRL